MAVTQEELKSIVGQHCGKRVFYHAANGRRRSKDDVAVIEAVYSSLFTLHLEKTDTVISFRYTDLLTHDVELVLCETGEKIY